MGGCCILAKTEIMSHIFMEKRDSTFDLNLFYSTEDKKIEATRSYFTKKNSKVHEIGENSEEGNLNILNEEPATDSKEITEETIVTSRNIIKFPRLEIFSMDCVNPLTNNHNVILTPNSINGIIKYNNGSFVFGSSNGSIRTDCEEDITPIDYSFNDISMGFSQFEIIYEELRNKFYVVDNKKGTGVFAKINKKLLLNREVIISFCSSHMILQVTNDTLDPGNKIIKIRFLKILGHNILPKQVFNSKDKKIIRIGRSNKAEVIIDDISVSRIQCTVVFENNDWVLYDGVYHSSKKCSTNGICKTELKSDMILRSGNTTMHLKMING